MSSPLEMPEVGDEVADEDDAEITDAELDAAEEEVEEEERAHEAGDLGAFAEADYAERIAGWEFKTVALELDAFDVEAYYRRPLGADPGTRWERIGHSRAPDALDLKRLVYCAKQRDLRAQRSRERRALIESLFGPGAQPVVDSLLATRSGEAAPGPLLTPRQEAFCRHFLTEPSGTRAAILAGYAASGARQEAHRLLTNADILQKISALRRANALSYALDRDAVLDKLEWVFDEAMKAQSHSAALRALLAQAELGGLLNRRHKATERAEARARAEVADGASMLGNDDKR